MVECLYRILINIFASAKSGIFVPIHFAVLLKWKGIRRRRISENHNDYMEAKIEFIENLF
jgi:hypothetical protein